MKICVAEVKCPRCGAEETHPADSHEKPIFRRLLIKGFKVCDRKGYWWSQCLVCAGYYDDYLNETRDNYDPKRGWF